MKDTKIVFVGIAVLVLFPLLSHGVRSVIKLRKDKKAKNIYYSLAVSLIACIAVIALIIGTYRFTISYQAPLVVEQYLRDEGFAYLEDKGIDYQKYSAFLSENIYENDDGTVTMYIQLQSGDENIYMVINMKKQGKGWQVIEHEIITGDYEEYPELKKRFYPI
ncbi:MAG: hypothetical protein WBI74_03250 [Caldicoprobacterales bacterium]|jgi:hypothetical protein|nr:hypothetical protein [Clostridiales bacterium]